MEIQNIDLLFDKNPNPMLIYDPDSYQIIEVNQAAVEQYGYDRKEFTSLTIKDIRPKSDVPKLEEKVKEREKTLKDSGVWRHKTKEGKIIYVRVISHKIKSSGKRYRLIVVSNATKEIELEQDYLKEKELLSVITGKLPGKFFVFNKDFELLRWNENMEKMTGYSEEELKKVPVLKHFKESERDKIKGVIKEVFEEGHKEIESEIVRKNGEIVPILFNASRVNYHDEKCVVGIGLDISRLKELLRQKEVLLTEINHRVKNNLAVISGLLQLEQFKISESKVSNILNKTQIRIQALAQIYGLLYQSKDIRKIRFDTFIGNFIETIKNNFATKLLGIEVETREINLNINQAIPFSLLLNEVFHILLSGPEESYGSSDLRINLQEQKNVVMFKLHADRKAQISGLTRERVEKNYALINILLKQLEANIYVQNNGSTDLSIEFEKRNLKGSAATVNV